MCKADERTMKGVFYQDAHQNAYGVGHASFTKSPDGSEDWIIYHGMRDPTNGWAARTIRVQKFTWNADGTPKFLIRCSVGAVLGATS
jgi:GH43 family beta-xylosidase